ncbi:coiled-coil domain-containing protein 107 isoform X2 [Tenrec ecaudatus]|uniref:coiled-coil domain-containing protein 107 isoform X2 n=1 Tax=Tenrec ecaudatus TaxID=94439 RepID=UPI003F5A07FE
MPEVVSLWGVLGLLLVSVLSGLLGDRPSPDPRAPPGDLTRTDLGAPEPRRRPPPKDQALPLGALYTAAVVAFVLYKCLQGKHEAAILPEEEADKEPLQSEQQLALLTQQLAQTEQHLNNLMAQLDPLFECVATLAGAQQQLRNTKLQTIHQLLRARRPEQCTEVPEAAEDSIPFPEDLYRGEAGDSRAWEEPVSQSTETWDLTTAWEAEQGLRRRSCAAGKGSWLQRPGEGKRVSS